MLEELNELEKIGLAFMSGVVAGYSLKNADQEVENEDKCKTNNKTINITVGQIEDKKIEKIMKMLKELGVEDHE